MHVITKRKNHRTDRRDWCVSLAASGFGIKPASRLELRWSSLPSTLRSPPLWRRLVAPLMQSGSGVLTFDLMCRRAQTSGTPQLLVARIVKNAVAQNKWQGTWKSADDQIVDGCNHTCCAAQQYGLCVFSPQDRCHAPFHGRTRQFNLRTSALWRYLLLVDAHEGCWAKGCFATRNSWSGRG